MNTLKKIWHDSVWSKVISGIILGGLTALYLTVTNNWQNLWSHIPQIADWFVAHILQIMAFFSLFVALIYWRKYRQIQKSAGTKKNKNVPNDGLTGLKWLNALSVEDWEHFGFLTWFIYNRKLQTEPFRKRGVTVHYGDFSFGAIPEIATALERRVIRVESISLTEYVVEIDRECYNFLEKALKDPSFREDPDFERKEAEHRAYMTSISFGNLFPRARNRNF